MRGPREAHRTGEPWSIRVASVETGEGHEIWRAANLLLKRYGHKAGPEATARAHALVAAGDREGEAVWHRITHAVAQLANKTPPGPMH